jgi:acylphosphatase
MKTFEILTALSNANIDYVLVGGVAVGLHGYIRATMDVDIVMAMNDENLEKFISVAQKLGLKPVLPIDINELKQADKIQDWIQNRHMLAFGLRSSDSINNIIDVMVQTPVSFESLKSACITRFIASTPIQVASIDHLIEMKTDTGRSKDALDIIELKKLRYEF